MAMARALAPVRITGDEGSDEQGESARMASFVGAIAIADVVKTTMGPKGMDKILLGMGGDVRVTNDGATILKSIVVDNPAAKILVDLSKVQDEAVGDGTTSVCVLAGELLREAEKLIARRIHPNTIIEGYRMALEAALAVLDASSVDRSEDEVKFSEDLFNVARTILSSKILAQHKDLFSNLAVQAVARLKGSTDLGRVQIVKKIGGTLSDSYLEDGFIIAKKFGVGQPTRIENAKVLVANTQMDTDKIKIFGSRVRVDGAAKVGQLEKAEKEKMKRKCDKILAHGINCFVNRQLIYNYPEQYFAEHGVAAVEHADFEGIENLALVLGGEIASTFDDPEHVKLGYCKLIDEVMIGEDKLIRFSGCAASDACTMVLRGGTTQTLEEAERSIHDALCVLSLMAKEGRVILGAGAAEMLMAKAVDELAYITPGKKSFAISSFAQALRVIPTCICDNAGLDSSELIAVLRAQHTRGNSEMGIDITTGGIGNIRTLGVLESLKVKRQILLSAEQAAEMIVRVDTVHKSTPRKREPVRPGM